MTGEIDIRPLVDADAAALLDLLRLVAGVAGAGLARQPDEFSADYAAAVVRRAAAGVALGAFADGMLVGTIHCARMEPRQFAHVLTDLTVAVSPRVQGAGVGSRLFADLFARVEREMPGIRRVELVCRSGNEAAIRLYARLGFVAEGRFADRVVLPDGQVEDDIAMAKFFRRG